MPKCVVCGFVDQDLRKHIKSHGLTKNLYEGKFPEAILIEPALHAELKAKWLAKYNEKKQRKLDRAKVEQNLDKDTNKPVFTGKWHEYYSKIKIKYIDEYKFAEGPELDDLLFFLVSNRQIQEQYDRMVSTKSLTEALESNILNNIRQNNQRIQELLVTLIDFKQTREKTQDIVNLHDETLKKAAAFVKHNYGEFVFRCPDCGQMLDNFGFPHPFFEATDKYSVFSKELWELILRKMIPIEYAAYILHTSIEGIINTAQFREEANIEIDLLTAEKNLKELRNVSQV
jgi:hypothetical protein